MKSQILPLIDSRAILAYWWTSTNTTNNFGDLITPLILEHYNFTPVYASPKRARLVGTGSLIEHVPANYSGYILGTGAISDKTRYAFPNAQILGVRGELTRRLLDAPKDVTLGDPGLMAVRLAGIQAKPQWTLGIVPHYVDQPNVFVQRLQETYPSDIRIINVLQNPTTVFQEIASCQNIISSSLHGIITADALAIPNRWIILSDKVLGGTFKFRDYYSSYELQRSPLEITQDIPLRTLLEQIQPPPPNIEKKQEELMECTRAFLDRVSK